MVAAHQESREDNTVNTEFGVLNDAVPWFTGESGCEPLSADTTLLRPRNEHAVEV